jgi:hypothetical protein
VGELFLGGGALSVGAVPVAGRSVLIGDRAVAVGGGVPLSVRAVLCKKAHNSTSCVVQKIIICTILLYCRCIAGDGLIDLRVDRSKAFLT